MPSITIKLPDSRSVTLQTPEGWSREQMAAEAERFTQEYMANLPGKEAMENLASKITPKAKKPDTEMDRLVRRKSSTEAAMISAGREMSALGTGIRRGWNWLTGDTDEYERLKRENDMERELMDPLREEHPIATMIGSTLPYLAASPTVSAGLVRGGLKLGGKVLPSALKTMPTAVSETIAGRGMLPSVVNPLKVAGATMERMSNMPTSAVGKAVKTFMADPIRQSAAIGGAIGAVHPDDSWWKGALQAGAGAGLVKTVLWPFSKAPNYLTKPQKVAAKDAKELGIHLLPGTKTGDPLKGQLDALMRRDPISAPTVRNIDLENNTVISRHIGKMFGVVDDTPTWNSDTIAKTFDIVGDRLGHVAKNSTPTITNKIFNQMTKDYKNYSKWPGTSNIAKDWLDDIFIKFGLASKTKSGKLKFSRTTGSMSGEEFESMMSRLRYLKNSQYTNPSGDRELGRYIGQLEDRMYDALEAGVSHPNYVKIFKDARKDYRKLNLIVDSVDGNSGIIDLGKLYKNMTSGPGKNKFKFIQGNDLFAKLGRIGKLQAETKTSLDLGTRGALHGVVGETRPVMQKIYRNSIRGLGAIDPSRIFPKGAASLYLNSTGWPAATGLIPIMSDPAVNRAAKAFARSTLGDTSSSDQFNIWEE